MSDTLGMYLFPVIGLCVILYIAYRTKNELSGASKRRVSRWLELFVLLACMGWFAYGIIAFPDAPYTICGEGYCGKAGQPHTKDEYEAFLSWQQWLFIVFPLSWVMSVILHTKKKNDTATS